MNIHLECLRCGNRHLGSGLGASGCPSCAKNGKPTVFSTAYRLDEARPRFEQAIDGCRKGIKRYTALLPVTDSDLQAVDVGDTPLIEMPELASEFDIARLWLKDESRGPTWSFKDRASVVAAAHATRLASPALVVASTGNAAAATAAHARRVGVPAIIFLSQNVDPVMAAFVRAYGVHAIITESKADRWHLMRYCVEELGCYPNSNYADPPVGNNPWAVDGYKTIGFEIWEQLGYRLPSDIIFPTCYGDALFGTFKAFTELRNMGYISTIPRIRSGEVYGSLESALNSDADIVSPGMVEHQTDALSISSPQSTYQALHAIRESDGWSSALSEVEMAVAENTLAERAGLYVERSAAASLAALKRQRADGSIDSDAEVVIINSSAGLKSVSTRLSQNQMGPIHKVEEAKQRLRELVRSL